MADYAPLYQAIAELLGKPTTFYTPTPDPLMVRLTGMLAPVWLAQIPCVTGGTNNYDDVNPSAEPNVTNGLAVIIADVLHPSLLANQNDGRGAVIEEKAGSVTEKYAAGSSSSTTTATQEPSASAVKAAWAQWALIACVRDALAASASSMPPPMQLAGRRRNIISRCGRSRGERGMYW